MQIVTLGCWGAVAIYGNADAGSPGVPGLPGWLPAEDRFRAARVTMQALPARALDYIAVWPADEQTVPDPEAGSPWTVEQLDGVLLAQPAEHWLCAVCTHRVNALAAETGLPFLNQFARHRWASRCPHCGAHVDKARLHALALFVSASHGDN